MGARARVAPGAGRKRNRPARRGSSRRARRPPPLELPAMMQPAAAPAIDPSPFDRLLELLQAAKATREALDKAPPEERAQSYPQRVKDRDKATAELARLTREARVEGAAVGLTIGQLDMVLTSVAEAIHHFYSRAPAEVTALAYLTASSRLEAAADFALGRARLAETATAGPCPATASVAAPASVPAPIGPVEVPETLGPGEEEEPGRDELNRRAGAYLLKHKGREARGQRSGRVTLEELARAIGCKRTMAAGLPAWKAVQGERKRRDKGAATEGQRSKNWSRTTTRTANPPRRKTTRPANAGGSGPAVAERPREFSPETRCRAPKTQTVFSPHLISTSASAAPENSSGRGHRVARNPKAGNSGRSDVAVIPIAPRLITVGVIAEKVSAPLHRVLFILRTRAHIRPAAYADRVRLYDSRAVAMVRHELSAIDARHCSRGAPPRRLGPRRARPPCLGGTLRGGGCGWGAAS